MMARTPKAKPGCLALNCKKKAEAKGLCQSHYYRLKKYGDPNIELGRVINEGQACAANECASQSYVKGFCKKHYARLRKYGDANFEIKSPKGLYVGCKVEGCEKKHSSKGYCNIHYASFVKYGDPLITKQSRKRVQTFCLVEGCERKYSGLGYCSLHRTRFNKYGTPTPDIKHASAPGANLSNGVTKKCTTCGILKPNSEFHTARKRPDKLSIYCKECSTAHGKARYANETKRKRILERGRLWRDRNPESDVRKHLLRKYGMTLEQYDDLFSKQNGVCALCGLPENTRRNKKTIGRERLAVDHCHDTGNIRGLLCFKCNTAVGSIGDDEASARRVVEYLASFKIDPKSRN